MEEMNLEKNDEQDHLYKKEESFQEMFYESRTLEVVLNKEKDINISYTPYEEEIKKSPPNMREGFNQSKEELTEKNNFENKEDGHCIEEEHCHGIANEKIILNVEKKEKENIFKKQISHLIEDSSTLGQPRVDYIEYWFESIVIPPTKTSLLHTLFDPIVVNFGHAPDFHVLDLLVETTIFLLLLELISKVNWMLEWLHWKSVYT
jgi:hypothetical protein